METNNEPKTLREAIIHYSDLKVCTDLMVQIRWPSGKVICPYCGKGGAKFMESVQRFKCYGCKKQFSVKVGTVLEDSPIPLTKWLPAFWLLVSAKNGISSCELARSLGVTQKTAWFILHRIRHTLKIGTFEKMSGTVEVDETYLGGLEKNKHKGKKLNAGRGAVGKAVIAATLERGDGEGKHSRVQTAHIKDTDKQTLQGLVKANVEQGTTVYTDSHSGYQGLSAEFIHEFVNHAVEYARGAVSTNGLENYFSLLKRTVKGTYVSIDGWHLAKYMDEQAFRFNTRRSGDYTRFLVVLGLMVGKRLTFDTLVNSGKEYFEQFGV
jgi:transposase-like protein